MGPGMAVGGQGHDVPGRDRDRAAVPVPRSGYTVAVVGNVTVVLLPWESTRRRWAGPVFGLSAARKAPSAVGVSRSTPVSDGAVPPVRGRRGDAVGEVTHRAVGQSSEPYAVTGHLGSGQVCLRRRITRRQHLDDVRCAGGSLCQCGEQSDGEGHASSHGCRP